MARSVITIKELGENTSWMLIQQAIGIPDAKMLSDYMEGKVGLLLFARQSLPERLCVTAAIRQMGGTTIYEGDRGGHWQKEVHTFQKDFLPIFGYYVDCLYTYGFPVNHWNPETDDLKLPIINAGSPDAHPAHALADIACMLKSAKDLNGIKTAWIGCANGTLFSLLEAMRWHHFSMKICAPREVDHSALQAKIDDLRIPAVFVDTPEEACQGASFIYAGYRGPLTDIELNSWKITPELMGVASRNVKLLLSASPVRAILIDPDILSGPASRLRRQAEYRLRIHKRILHWVLEGQ